VRPRDTEQLVADAGAVNGFRSAIPAHWPLGALLQCIWASACRVALFVSLREDAAAWPYDVGVHLPAGPRGAPFVFSISPARRERAL